MARVRYSGNQSVIDHVKKRTTIGRGKLKTSAMNKAKRRTYKKYRGQGK